MFSVRCSFVGPFTSLRFPWNCLMNAFGGGRKQNRGFERRHPRSISECLLPANIVELQLSFGQEYRVRTFPGTCVRTSSLILPQLTSGRNPLIAPLRIHPRWDDRGLHDKKDSGADGCRSCFRQSLLNLSSRAPHPFENTSSTGGANSLFARFECGLQHHSVSSGIEDVDLFRAGRTKFVLHNSIGGFHRKIGMKTSSLDPIWGMQTQF